MTRRIIFNIIFSAVLFLGIFLFLWLWCPQYLLYQEQNQLFLFSRSYLANAVSVPGGFADYVSEFIVQFYYVPLFGAFAAALVLTLSQVFLGLACRRCSIPATAYVLAAVPSVLYLAAMGDENMLMSLGVAMMLTVLFIYLATLSVPNGLLSGSLTVLVGFCILYWLAGPFAIVFISSWCILRRRLPFVALLAALMAVWSIHRLWFGQYPLSSLTLGINYYRIPEVYPVMFFIIVGATAVVPLITRLKTGLKGWVPYAVAAVLAVFAVVYVPASFDKEKSRILSYDSLVRQGRWTDIIARAEEERPSDSFSLQAVNLALAMTGQLPESMFRFNQNGLEGLIGAPKLDNTSQLVTQEALFRLGLTNAAFMTAFDLQESIMNDRKSGRLMKRLAECMIVNGNYEAAAKYIGFLQKSLFYADWAQQAGSLLFNDDAVAAHPVYGPLRRNAFTQEAFYDSSQIDRICAILAMDSGGANQLAWQYFCAAALLKGELDALAGMCGLASEKLGLVSLPRHVEEALALSWTFTHTSFDGIPFPISEEVRHTTANLARAMMANKDNPSAWRAAAPGTFGVYFLSNSFKKQEKTAPEYQSTHE